MAQLPISLFDCDSISSLFTWVSSGALPDVLKSLRSGTSEDRRDFEKKLKSLKKKLHYSTNDGFLTNMFEKYHNGNAETKKDIGKEIAQYQNRMMETEEYKTYMKVFGLIDREFSAVIKMEYSAFGRSNRARQAKNANELFSKHCGVLKPEGANLDKDGNAAGLEFDLGTEGAFVGLKVVVLQQYVDSTFDFSYPLVALQSKGFDVTRFTGVVDSNTLADALDGANQFWLISTCCQMLKDDQIELILNFWRSGRGIYIFGDNSPYYVDANKLLKTMNFPEMSGNYPAGQYITPFNEKNKIGYVTHAVTTGISNKLFEGHTIAEFKLDDVLQANCIPIMFNSRGGISVILREAFDNCGQVIVDGAFTKLYCQWDAAGSDRFVRNCACYLAADFSVSTDVVSNEVENVLHISETDFDVPSYDFSGCLEDICEAGGSFGPVSILAFALPEPDSNTSDFMLDDPMSGGRKNMTIFDDLIYYHRTAVDMVVTGENQFSRTAAIACIPAVKLDIPLNFTLMTKTLCDVLMGGKYLPTAAWLLFFSICDAMLESNRGNEKVWKYFIEQMLSNVKSTSDFTDVGIKMPLIQAMNAFASATNEMVQIRKSFTTTSLIARTLLSRQSVPKEVLVTWVRHSYLKGIAGVLISMAKGKSKLTKDWYDSHFDSLSYEMRLEIPVRGSAKILTRDKSVELINDWHAFIDQDLNLYIKKFDIGEIVSDEGFTTVLIVLRKMTSIEICSFALDAFVLRLCKNEGFKAVWDGLRYDPMPMLTDIFSHYRLHDKDDTPPFVTCFGPSGYISHDGVRFGDWDSKDPPTLEESEIIKSKRNAHFQAIYGADSRGYPVAPDLKSNINGSSFVSLHRAVQKILTKPEFLNDNKLTEEHLFAVAAYLIKDNKGDRFYVDLPRDISCTINSYLECRRAGMREPNFDKPITFHEKLVEEWKVRNKK